MPVHQDHQGKASSTFVLRAHQLLLFVATLHQFGTWVQAFAMRIDAQRAGAEASPSQGAGAPACARFCVPRLHWPRLRRELRSFTPGVLDEEHHAGAVSSFHSDHVVFCFPFPRVKCS